MIPFTFNVETCLKTNGTPPGSRDLFVPESSHREGHKLQSAMKFLGGFANRKGGVFLVGGILAVGCTVHFLCKRRNGKRASPEDERELGASHFHTGTQIDPSLAQGPVAKPSATKSKEEETDPVSSIEYADLFQEVPKNTSPVIETSEYDHIRLEFDCAPKTEMVCATKVTQEQHLCCHLPTILAVFALYKASMCEGSASKTHHCPDKKGSIHPETTWEKSWLFNPRMKPPEANVWKQEVSAFFNMSQEKAMNALQFRDRKPASKKTGVILDTSASSDRRPNLFGMQSQGTAFPTSGKEAQGEPERNNDFYDPKAPSSSSRTERVFEQNRTAAKDNVISNTAEQLSEGHKAPIASSTDWRIESGRSRQRRQSTRWGRNIRNNHRQEYVDLDNPKPIASQQRR